MPLQQNRVNLRPKSKFPENRHKKRKEYGKIVKNADKLLNVNPFGRRKG
jgi:hypothetical protein